MWINEFKAKKLQKEKILMVTAYDASQAKLVAETEVDMVLVGDSLAMVVHGFESTLYADIEMMTLHTASVARGLKGKKFIVGDMPFLSVRKGLHYAMDCVEKLMKAGASAVKIEGLEGHDDIIEHIVKSGIPVMGHLGLTPQSVHQLGGYKVQAKLEAEQSALATAAERLQDLGAFSLVLECVPTGIAQKISTTLTIPTIGIGAGPFTDGQVLVFHDLLGLSGGHKPKFLRQYLAGSSDQIRAINQFCADVKVGSFPNEQESYNV